MSTEIRIPDLCLVVLVGVSGSGKSTFAARHFAPTEIVSSDFCRALVSDDANDQTATGAAFEVLHTIAAKRLESGRIVVIDATSVRPDDRAPLVELAKRHHVFPVAIVLDTPAEVCRAAQRRPRRPRLRRARRSATSATRSADRSRASAARDSGASTSCTVSTRSTPRPSSASRCGPTSATRPVRSTSSATSTAATASSSRCWRRSDGK